MMMMMMMMMLTLESWVLSLESWLLTLDSWVLSVASCWSSGVFFLFAEQKKAQPPSTCDWDISNKQTHSCTSPRYSWSPLSLVTKMDLPKQSTTEGLVSALLSWHAGMEHSLFLLSCGCFNLLQPSWAEGYHWIGPAQMVRSTLESLLEAWMRYPGTVLYARQIWALKLPCKRAAIHIWAPK